MGHSCRELRVAGSDEHPAHAPPHHCSSLHETKTNSTTTTTTTTTTIARTSNDAKTKPGSQMHHAPLQYEKSRILHDNLLLGSCK
ncbi:hypothetical protein E2C01_093885 [Portunus trituberculatus]|uniref:Uncharacterized protein n=1 Tax=Portunus trituberculatus TaxID=210409 RepID=A0A5B7JR10_PORTR|nr:hypothetical protein [Portunus trituberculatus]